MRCYAPDPARGANSTPPNFLAGFGGRGKEGVTVGKRETEKKERASGKRNGKEKSERENRGEKEKGQRKFWEEA